jgi:D-alanyl-D-alanine carboxypeptidase/D-alanyl-D-alanine-endopeptidase (penicillin-binding protein 4)
MFRKFLFLFFLMPSIVLANDIETSLKNFVANKNLEGASISFMVYDLTNNKELISHEKYRLLSPASTMKLFSTAAALDILGPDYKPTTKVFYSGTLSSDSILVGDLIIKGFGDASLGSKYFNESGKKRAFLDQWAETIKKFGINKIDGRVVADASSFGYFGAPAGWTYGDMGNYYGAFPCGLTIFDNILELYFNTPSNPGEPARLIKTDPLLYNFRIDNFVKSENRTSDNSYVFSAPY